MKFKRYITICIILTGILIVSVFFVTPSKNFLFHNALGDCSGKAAFTYSALYLDTIKSNVLFLGSSKMMNGVNDSLLNVLSRNKRFLNLGYCRFGRNMDYFLFEEYTRRFNPDKIVVEVRDFENEFPHPMTPFLIDEQQIAEGFLTYRYETVPHLYDRWLVNLKYVREKIFFTPQEQLGFASSFGFWENLKHTPTEELLIKRKQDSIQFFKTDTQNLIIDRFSEYYLNKIFSLCSSNKIQLVFLYLPSYGNIHRLPAHHSFYREHGALLLPPDSISGNAANFADYSHLNRRGANLLSLWLKNQLDNQHNF